MAYWPRSGWPPSFEYGYSHPRSFQYRFPTDPNEALEEIDQIKSAAERTTSSKRRFELYECALDICSQHGFKRRAAVIHCDCAELAFKAGDLSRAIQEADESIKEDPDYLKGYHWSAVAQHRLWLQTRAPISAAHAVQDFAKYYRKTSREQKHTVLIDLCTAIMLAVDSKNTAVLKLGEFLTRDQCTALVTELLALKTCYGNHLQYVIMKTDMAGSGIAVNLKCDLSKLKTSKLFEKKGIAISTIEAAVKLGATVKLRSVEKAVKYISDDQVPILELSLTACDPKLDSEALTSLCNQALSLNKPTISSFLISKGAKPDNESVIKSINTQEPHESLVSYISSTPDGCVCLLMHAMNNSALDLAKRCLDGSTSIFSQVIDLSNFLTSSKGLLCQNPDFFEELLKSGANPDGLCDSNRPIDALLALPSDFEHKSRLICTLAECGADLTKATYPRTQATSIFHIGTEMAIQFKDVQILEKICSCYKFPEDFDTKTHATNKRGQTPYHLIMQQKQSDLTVKICEVLSKCPINPSLTDSRGQRPADFKLPKFKGDKRVPILQEAAKKFQAEQSRRKAKSSKSTAKKASSKSKKKGIPNEDNNELHAEEVIEDPTLPSEDGTTADPTNMGLASKSSPVIEDPNLRALKEFMDFLSKQSTEYFAASISYTRQASSHKSKVIQKHLPPESEPKPIHQVNSPVQPLTEKKVVKDEIDKEEEDSGINKDNILANFDDESLKWEVEFPDNVVKYFKGMSNDKILCLAIKKIQRLALGIPTKKNPRLCKRVRGNEEIYETRVTKAIRILWEVATQFSPTLTSKLRNSELSSAVDGNCYLYSEVIRIWDIVEDHDNLERSIDLAVERIKSCRQRGEQATTKVPLLPSSGEDHVSTGHSDDTRYPRVFTDRQLDSVTRELIAQQVFCYPAGSAKDDEYNVITFYPFDLTFVKSILEGEDARRDFPYKEWPKEHDIINMESRSILLLGRSGTGKTTCCLYRLWNYFKNYWSKANDAGPWLPARPLIFYDTNHDSDEESDLEDDSEVVVSQTNPLTSESQFDQCDSKSETNDSPVTLDSTGDSESQLESATTDLEHLHQIFITKNYVLCAQMKKRFYDLAAGNDVAKEHMSFEDTERPISLTKVDELAYPLFLTAREFFLILDNSLSDEREFFTRTPDGKLKEKIRSSDYDHEDPDTLLDLNWESDQEEGSESESSDDEAVNPQSEAKVKQPQRREVTASYFVEKIWPNIHHVCEDKKTDPLLIWMEIKSFIKGSRKTLESKKGYLTYEEYDKLGAKMAANFAGSRQEVYKVFEKYQHFIKHRADESLFDECEFIHSLFERLCKLKEVPFSIHSFYVDEVQDFTQAELSILLRCCKDPNNLFLTGDTAQSIMRGVSFRFSDLRSLFYKANRQAKSTQKKAMVTVPLIDKLTINFRSHSGVLKLAASVVDVLQNFFPNSFDCLPEDKGMFPGPIPTLLDSCDFSDLALLLRGNKRESSAIEFGAHQVIIVQSEDAKRALPSELQAGIALTVFEAKGLEFDDVLLYDFFKDSKVSKEWRIVTEFIENSPKLLAPKAFNKGFENKPRPLKFDEQHHKSLSAELKYLYTAITRAKCNLWIYDSDDKNRLPMFDYWHQRGLVKIIRLSEISQQDESDLFAATSTKEEWKKQGDYFKKKKLWEPAMKCYVKAEETYLEMEAKAFCLFQKARAPSLKPREVEELYLQAALAFLECDRSKHDVKFLKHAASFLKKAKRPNEAGLLYAKLNRQKDAVKEFKKSKNFQGLVRLKEQDGNYDDAVSLLLDNGRRDEAIKCAEQYENEGQVLRGDLQASVLATRFAKEICNQASTQRGRNRLAKLVKFMNNPMDRVYYLKIARKHRDAFNILCNEKRFDEAYRMCAAQGWVDDGLKLADEQKNGKWTQEFIFQKAISGLVQNDKVDVATITRLHSLKSSKNDQVKAKACLLLGKCDHDFFLCRRAFDIYVSTRNAAGCIEAFNLMIKFRTKGLKSADIDTKQTLDACNKATDANRVLDSIINHRPLSGAAQERTLILLQEFYGMQRQYSDKSKSVYLLAPKQHLWVDICSGHSVFDTDLDGMIEIDCIRAQKTIRSHIQAFLKRWKEKDELQVCQWFRSRLSSFQFHKQLEDKGCVKKSFKRLPIHMLSDYLKLCCTGLQLSDFANGEIKHSYVVQLMMNCFKPTATLYLGVTRRELEWIAKSSSATFLEQHSGKTLQRSDHNFHVDDWLEAWGILSILGKYRLENLLKQLDKCTKHANTLPKAEVPPVYVRDSQSDGYMHIVSMWIRSCILIQSDKRVIASSKVVLRYFLEVIARRKSIRLTLSITNLVNILTIHTTALLSLTALCNFMQRKSSNVLVPNSYECVLNVFDNIGKQVSKDSIKVLDACMKNNKVLKAYDKIKMSQNAVQHIQDDITHLLQKTLDMLLGIYSPYFQPLKDALKSDDCIRRGEARHCLLLTLVLFGNLTEIDQCNPSDLQYYHKCIKDTLKHVKDSTDDESQVLRKAHSLFSSSLNSTVIFLAIGHLIATADSQDYIARFDIRQQRPAWTCELERANPRQYPARPLLHAVNKPSQLPTHGDHTVKSDMSSQNVQIQLGNVSNPEGTAAMSLQQAVDLSLSSTVLSHPANAYLIKSTNPHEVESTYNLQQNMSIPIDGNFSPPATPTVMLTSQISVEPQEEEETVINIEDDEDLKNLALSAPFVLDRQVSERTAQQAQSAMMVEDTSMVDEQFCRFCAVSLRADEIVAPVAKQDEEQALDGEEHGDEEPTSEDQGEQVEIESYASHCVSERHMNNVKARENFVKLKKEFYEPLREKLSEELQKLKKFENENITSNLRTIVQEIEKELEKDEKALNDIPSSAEWKVGASQIEQDMLGCMDALITAAEDKLLKEQARVQREEHLRKQAAVQDEVTDDENVLDGEGSQSEDDIIKEVDASKVREKERQEKRDKKKKSKANRHSKSRKY